MRLRLLALLVVVVALVPIGSSAGTRPPIRRVFVYVMENTSYDDVVGSPDAPYLNSLIKRFTLATNYTATGHASLDNYVAMTSAQPPNPATMGDCFFYGTPLCIQDVPHIGDQLDASGHTWKGYMDAMPKPCTHTAENTPEKSQTGYTPRHNPFLYYRSVVDDQQRCEAHDVPMTELWRDMKAGTVPDYAFITPDTCHDGHDSGASCKEGGGVHEADSFAKRTIPRILADPSWREGGLLVVTFDEGGVADDDAPAPNGQTVDFGGRIYTVLAYPGATPGSRLEGAYNHYSLLKTVEDVFCLDHLANAALPQTASMLPAIGAKRCAKAAGTPVEVKEPSASVAAAVAPALEAQQSTPRTGASSARTSAIGVAMVALSLALLALTRRSSRR